MISSQRKRQKGMTIVEVVVASVISTLALFSALTLFIGGAGMWVRGAEMMEAESQSRQAVRVISDQLRNAMVVTLDGNGQGVTFRLPQRSQDGTFVSPAVWDGATRRMYHSSGKILLEEPSGTRAICRNIVLTDADNGNAAYTIFTAGAGSIVRQVTVKIVTQVTVPAGPTYRGRKRETVYLRNVPTLTK